MKSHNVQALLGTQFKFLMRSSFIIQHNSHGRIFHLKFFKFQELLLILPTSLKSEYNRSLFIALCWHDIKSIMARWTSGIILTN